MHVNKMSRNKEEYSKIKTETLYYAMFPGLICCELAIEQSLAFSY